MCILDVFFPLVWKNGLWKAQQPKISKLTSAWKNNGLYCIALRIRSEAVLSGQNCSDFYSVYSIHQSFLFISYGSVVEHCVSSAKGCGFNSQGTHILIKQCIAWMHCKSLWIKASAKCINVNVKCKISPQTDRRSLTVQLLCLSLVLKRRLCLV